MGKRSVEWGGVKGCCLVLVHSFILGSNWCLESRVAGLFGQEGKRNSHHGSREGLWKEETILGGGFVTEE